MDKRIFQLFYLYCAIVNDTKTKLMWTA